MKKNINKVSAIEVANLNFDVRGGVQKTFVGRDPT
jgi:hypothetical protein